MIPIDTKPIEPSSVAGPDLRDAIAAGRLLAFPFPRRIVKRLYTSAFRFFDLNLDTSPRHMHDIVVSMFFTRLLSTPGVVSDCIERSWIDTMHPKAVVIYILIKPSEPRDILHELSILLMSVLQSNAKSVGVWKAPDTTPEPADDATPGAARPSKRQKPNGEAKGTIADQQRQAALYNGWILMKSSVIPVYDIIGFGDGPAYSVFPKPEGFGQLVTNEDELQLATADFIARRFEDAGYTVNDIFYGQRRIPDEHDPTGPTPTPSPARSGPIQPFISTSASFSLVAPGHLLMVDSTDEVLGKWARTGSHTLSTKLEDFMNVQKQHPALIPFLKDSILKRWAFDNGDTGVLELHNPSVDLPTLNRRYIVPSHIFK